MTERSNAGRRRVVLFVTYTMDHPLVGGAFFRALRLAVEFHRRGWVPMIFNSGPHIDDPKVDEAQGKVVFIQSSRQMAHNPMMARDFFKALEPDVIVFGESPFDTMKPLWRGAQMVSAPFAVLDQYYFPLMHRNYEGVDLMMRYGLKCLWQDALVLQRNEVMVPPFIEGITPKEQLPIPVPLHGMPWVTLIGYSRSVIDQGVKLLQMVDEGGFATIAISREPARTESLLREAGIEPAVSLPLQSDANVYGFMEASRVALVSNGFLQIMDGLALACPVVSIRRGNAGIAGWTVAGCYRPYVSIDENRDRQCAKIRRWLRTDPFPPGLRAALTKERHGTIVCADLIEDLAAGRSIPDVGPLGSRWMSWLRRYRRRHSGDWAQRRQAARM